MSTRQKPFTRIAGVLLALALLVCAAGVSPAAAAGVPAEGYPFLLGAARGADNGIVPLLSYAPGENPGAVSLTGAPGLPLAETFRQYETKPSSAHPDGVAWFWVRDDAENVYFVCDWTSDDTYDDGEDYFTVYVGSGAGIKAYTQHSDGGQYGASFFTSSAAADFDHMIYVIAVPKAELSGGALKVGFELYGTASTSGTLSWNGTPPGAAETGVPVTFSAHYETGSHYKNHTAFLLEYNDAQELADFLYDYDAYDPVLGTFYDYYSRAYEGNDIRVLGKTDFVIPGEYDSYNRSGTASSGNVNIETTFTSAGAHKLAIVFYLNEREADYYAWSWDTSALIANITVSQSQSAAEPTAIHDRAGLAAIAGAPDGDYILANDIDLGGTPWTPIANFTGSLNGNGHMISGLRVNTPVLLGTADGDNFTAIDQNGDEPGVYGAGLFAAGADGAVVRNLTLASPVVAIDTNGMEDAVILAGAVYGYAEGGQLRSTSVVSPNISVDVNNSTGVAFAVGGAAGLVSDVIPVIGVSVSGGAVSGTLGAGNTAYEMAFHTVGGVVGASIHSIIVNAASLTDVSLETSGYMNSIEAAVGGIAGYVAADAQLLYCLHNSYSRANVTFTNTGSEYCGSASIGGIAGILYDSAINNYYVPPAGGGVRVSDPYSQGSHDIGVLFGYANTYGGHTVSRNYFTGDTSYEAIGYGYDVPAGAVVEINNASALLAALNAGREAVAENIYEEYGVEHALSIVYEWILADGGWPVHVASDVPQPGPYAFTAAAETGGTVSGTANGSYAQGADIRVTAAANSGYRFAGWTADGVTLASNTANPAAFNMPANAVTLTANFETAGVESGPAYYTMRFETNGGSKVDEQHVGYNGKAVRPADPVKDGFTFAGWYSDKALTAVFDFGAGLTGSVTVYAKWTAKWENPFIDVKEADWFYGDVAYVHTNGVMNGTSANTFSPGLSVTRGMLVTVLYRAAGSPGTSGAAPFTDVAADKYYAGAVAWAAANGLVTGIGGDQFAPEAPVTRQDLAVILLRRAEKDGLALPAVRGSAAFGDEAAVASYAKAAVEALYRAGIINGRPGGSFDPKGGATRAETAALLHRFLEALKK
ncbi:MAG: S-layer homology domain-containing protein [Oscillospiraceae bacterium]|jgi:uncharacterized repeat protein (TIGR02543 family)|nr:S-layer homology domain-containing protein [Oscillospiraceae bacterium]